MKYFRDVTDLKLIFPDIDLAEKPVHYVTRQQKDVGMTVLIQTNLKRFLLSINLKYFISTPCRQIGTNKSFIVGHTVIGLY